MKKRSVILRGHSTSITLEDEFWLSLKDIADAENRSVNTLIEEIEKTAPVNLSGAIRVFVLKYYKSRL